MSHIYTVSNKTCLIQFKFNCVAVMYTNEEECVVRNLLKEVPVEELTEQEFDSDTWSDHVSESDHFSGSDDDAEPESAANSADGHQVYKLKGKDGTEWSTEVPTKNKRTSSCNIVRTHLPCVKKQSQHFKSPIDCFQLFVTDEMYCYIPP
jgi:hypothetical protein